MFECWGGHMLIFVKCVEHLNIGKNPQSMMKINKTKYNRTVPQSCRSHGND